MRRILKWIGIVLGVLLGLVVLAAVILYAVGTSKLNKTLRIQPEAVEVPSDSASIERGRHLVEGILLCQECHGDNLGGTLMVDEPGMGRVYAANLTSGKGGAGASFTDADFVRAIRHGVAPDGRELAIMPAEIFNHLSDQDLGALIAYLKTVPPVDNETPKPQLMPLGRIMLAAGMLGNDVFPAELIDHTAPLPPAPEPGITAAYGEYLSSVSGCPACHGPDLSGAKLEQEGGAFAPNLTPGGELAGWDEAGFVTALRTGVTPSGHQLNPENMPWKIFSRATDDELKAIWLYLQSLPAKQSSN